jgi:hypothetical protein
MLVLLRVVLEDGGVVSQEGGRWNVYHGTSQGEEAAAGIAGKDNDAHHLATCLLGNVGGGAVVILEHWVGGRASQIGEAH